MKSSFKFYSAMALLAVSAGCTKAPVSQSNSLNGFDFSSSAGLSFPSSGVQYFVSSSVGNDSYDGSQITVSGTHGPFATINHANAVVSAGDQVNIAPGDYYYVSGSDATVYLNKSGSTGSPIIYQAYDASNRPRIHATSANNFDRVIAINASYVTLKNLEIIGELVDPVNVPGSSPTDRRFNTNGIAIGGFTPDNQPAFVNITGCSVHNLSGAGIVAIKSDRITIENNEVYLTSFYSINATSGISVLTPNNIDPNNGSINDPKIIIRKNVCHDNIEYKPNKATGTITDGNGIIADVNTIYSGNTILYNGFTSIENNISYNNGGSGIQATGAHNINFINNTCYHNGQKIVNGELDSYHSYNLTYSSNIMYSVAGGICSRALSIPTGQSGTIIFNYNVYYDGTSNPGSQVNVTDLNPRQGDPKFIGPLPSPSYTATLLAVPAEFKLTVPGSSAGNKGYGATNGYTPFDYIGVARLVTPPNYPDCGTFESYQ